MSAIFYHNQRALSDYEELAVLDESADYEVDVTEIWYDPRAREFLLLTATGCSCWDGEYNEERFKSLDELERSLLKDERTYQPSFRGVETLIEQAKDAFKRSNRDQIIEVNGVFVRKKAK